MELEGPQGEELRELAARLDRLIPREGAHLTMPAEPGGHSTIGNQLGYLRLGVEFLSAALRPLHASDQAPARIEPNVDYLLSGASDAPFDLCEIDEAIGSRAPVETRLGFLGQLVAGVGLVTAILLLLLAAFLVLRAVFT